ncbi:hypothetical protein T07_4925 [Trichinella nelsoni]|uniref:Uncharacterized protein n=1 Tax=Trichinella nelsoni TaxID=6336 RepID=A0A0V0RMW7_9BILA|nr:hypothetical protein T07_4925 [Trichinella nelsoni]
MNTIKVHYHKQRCSSSFDYVPRGNVVKCSLNLLRHKPFVEERFKNMNNGEKRILNAVYTEQKAGVTKLNNRMQEDSVIRGWGYTERIVYILTELSMSSI